MTAPGEEPVLLLDSVGKAFGERRALASAYFAAPAGSVTALFGRNGAGKTTLLRIGAGLLAADYGTVRFRGRRIDRAEHHRLARDGMMFVPERDFFWKGLRLGRQLELIAEQSHPRSERLDRLAWASESLDLGARLRSRAGALSGGELRKAQVAAALVRRPACLLVDEPFLSVSPLDAERIATGLRSLGAEGTAVVATGHEVSTLLQVCDRVSWVTAGTCYELGTPADARGHDLFRRAYAGRL